MPSQLSVRTLLIIAGFLQITWGFVPSASRFVIEEIPVELYISLRWTISGFIFLSYILLTRSYKKVTTPNMLSVACLGILGYGLASLGTLYGLKVAGVSNFGLTSSMGPIIISLVSIVLLKEKPDRLFFYALPLCVVGLIILVYGKFQTSSFSIAGGSALLILAGFTLEAIAFVYSKRFKSKMGIPQYLAISQISAAGIFWCLQFLYFNQLDSLHGLTWKGWTAAVFVSTIACVLCYAVLYWLLNYVPGHRLALFDGLHALSASVLGYFLFKEVLTPLMMVGGLFIFCGLILGNLNKSAGS